MFTGIFVFTFTVGAGLMVALVGRRGERANDEDRRDYDRMSGEERRYRLLLHIRQDVKLIAFALFGIMIMLGVMLGIIADRIH
jgi:hypothetical protein